jgi:hypothetical protein
MKKLVHILYITAISALFISMAGMFGCETDSPETIVREVGLFIGGFYRHPNDGNFMVPRTSGQPITSMNLIQSGDQLNAFDNHGFLYRGTIGRVLDGTQASITLEGQSTAGNAATINGIVVVSGNTATMEATWLEDALASPVFGQALVPTNAPSQPPDGGNEDVEISPASVTLNAGGGTQTFTASGGSGDFTWALIDSGLGGITSITGSRSQTAVYSAQGVGTQTITVRDVNGDGDSSSIVQTTEGAGGPIPP